MTCQFNKHAYVSIFTETMLFNTSMVYTKYTYASISKYSVDSIRAALQQE